LLVVAALGIVIMVILWIVVRQPEKREQQTHPNILGSLWQVIKERQNWISGLFITFINFPIAIFGALFGVSFLTTIYKVSSMQGASITSMLFWGMIFASPLFGWISDVMHRRKSPMFIGAILCLFFMILVLYSNNLGTVGLHILFFLIGFTSASQVIGYPVIAESNPPETTGTGLSLAAILIMGLGFGIGHPVIGSLLDWNLKVAANTPAQAYHNTFILVPISITVGIIMLLFMKETYCSPIYQKNK
jgi:predicted MFS family arabinose efflux permease